MLTNIVKQLDREEIAEEYEYGNFNMILYGQTKKLKDWCNIIKEYSIEDSILLDKLLPKKIKH